jgi:hypothetical protein
MVPSGNHTDWPWPFSLIPRRWNAVPSEHEPVQLLGTASGHLDIPDRGTWTIAWPIYVALTSRKGWHFRFGIRYDYIDRYYTFPSFTIKKLK